MADDDKAKGDSEQAAGSSDAAKNEPKPELKPEQEKDALIKKLQDDLEQARKSQSGTDKTVKQLQDEINTLRKSKMSEEEKTKAENAELKSELRAARLTSFLATNQIDEEFHELFTIAEEKGWEGLAKKIKDRDARQAKDFEEKKVKPVQLELDQLKAKIGMPGGGQASGKGEATVDEYRANPALTQERYRDIAKTQGVDAAKAWLKTIYPE